MRQGPRGGGARRAARTVWWKRFKVNAGAGGSTVAVRCDAHHMPKRRRTASASSLTWEKSLSFPFAAVADGRAAPAAVPPARAARPGGGEREGYARKDSVGTTGGAARRRCRAVGGRGGRAPRAPRSQRHRGGGAANLVDARARHPARSDAVVPARHRVPVRLA